MSGPFKAPAPYEPFRALGPISPLTAREMAVAFEGRIATMGQGVSRDDFRWIVDSYLHERERREAAEAFVPTSPEVVAEALKQEYGKLAVLRAHCAKLAVKVDQLEQRVRELDAERGDWKRIAENNCRAAEERTVEINRTLDAGAELLVAAEERVAGIRPEVLAFARAMSAKLDGHNDDRGEYGWRTAKAINLLDWLHRYFGDIQDAVRAVDFRGDTSPEARALVASKATNVANLAMMIADVCGALPQDPNNRPVRGDLAGEAP